MTRATSRKHGRIQRPTAVIGGLRVSRRSSKANSGPNGFMGRHSSGAVPSTWLLTPGGSVKIADTCPFADFRARSAFTAVGRSDVALPVALPSRYRPPPAGSHPGPDRAFHQE